ncbi:SphA family protein [Cupriavidus lacunae]|uniref:SphA family protein n=1 Tax=Cupriavidus lacunae TaxID=2666307 RepID=UPI001FCA2EB1|nr:transporter [Cupriavidus lacunae]
MTYSFNSPNDDTHYHSGQLFHTDYSCQLCGDASHPCGVTGYFIKQTTDDKQNGHAVGGDGFRGQVLAVGPGLRYQFSKASLEVRWVKEFYVRNRPEGNALWAKLVVPF